MYFCWWLFSNDVVLFFEYFLNGRFEFYNEYVQFNKCIDVLQFNLVLLIRLVMPQPHTCQQNGVAKQKHHYFLDVIRTL